MASRSDPVPVRKAQAHPDLVEAAIELPGVAIELCAFPPVIPEKLLVVEARSVLLLGLSPLLAHSSGRFRAARSAPFARFGPLSFRPAGVPVELRFDGGAFNTIRCRFKKRRIDAVFGTGELSDAQLAACFDIQAPRIEDAMLRLAEELASPGPDSPALAAGLVRTITIDLARHLRDVDRIAGRRRGGLTSRHLRLVLDRIDHVGPPPAVGELAALCGLSRFHFIRSFGESLGVSPGVFIGQKRMARAKAMLAAGGRSLSEIARELGYSSLPAFAAAFRRSVGRPPGAYRACLR